MSAADADSRGNGGQQEEEGIPATARIHIPTASRISEGPRVVVGSAGNRRTPRLQREGQKEEVERREVEEG